MVQQADTCCGAITGFILGGITSDACFVAGTAVLTADGLTAIENIEPEDYVWAWDEETGEIGLRKVKETYVKKTEELVHIFVSDDEIITTPNHPFWHPHKGWTAAIDLRAGDILVLVNGEYVIVEKIQHEILERPLEVYNFQVEEYHTYYVSDSSVLVHNSCNHGNEWNKERRKHWKEFSKTAVEGVDYGPFKATKLNIDRMSAGKAPIGWDKKSVVLHHWYGIKNDFYTYSPVTQTAHRMIHKTIGFLVK